MGYLHNVDIHIENHLLVRNVSTVIHPGLTAVVGPSGAGKSTLIKAFCGLLPFKGEICLAQDVRTTPLSKQATFRAYVPQSTHLPFAYRVLDIVSMGRLPHDDSPRRARLLADEILSDLGLSHLHHRLFPTLSGGEKSRVIVARALCQLHGVNDGWLVLDEPTSALDIANALKLMDVIRRVTTAKKLHTLVVLHDLNLAASFADHVLMMHAGQLITHGTPAHVLTPELIYTAFGIHTHVHPHPDDQKPVVMPSRFTQESTCPCT